MTFLLNLGAEGEDLPLLKVSAQLDRDERALEICTDVQRLFLF
jgi:hypothetical protein